MPSTSYEDPPFQALAFQTRTDALGAGVVDVSGPELRLPWSMFTAGIRGVDDYKVAAGGGMSVTVGSGVAFDNLAVVAALLSQGSYGIRMEAATDTLTVPAADLSNPRIDEVYLVVVDDPGTMVKARLAYRAGDPAASPAVPGPDASWDGSLLLASVDVAAGETVIEAAHITDERVTAEAVFPSDTVRVGGNTAVGSGPVGATYQTEVSTTFTLPAGWRSAHVVARGAVMCLLSSATELDVRAQIGSSDGAAHSTGGALNTSDQYLDVVTRHEAVVTATATVTAQIREVSGVLQTVSAWVQFTAHRLT